jgi:uncharacterized surface protein with fasciclin (FAS1) repeats
MKNPLLSNNLRKTVLVGFFFASFLSNAQTNVYDDIIAVSADHTSLAAAITTAGLESALQDASATLTVFAPDNDAFDDLAAEFGTDIAGLLALPNLADILLYHVLPEVVLEETLLPASINSMYGTLVPEAPMYIQSNGLTITINGASSLILTDLVADNGVVHVVDAVVFDPDNNPLGIGEIQPTDVQYDGKYYNIMGQEIRSYEDIPLYSFYYRNGKKFIKTVE